MEKCLEIQKERGYKQAQANLICNAMKKKYAKESDNNEWLEAFAGDSRFTTEELRVMKQKASAILSKRAQMDNMDDMNFDVDLSAPLNDVQPVNNVENVDGPDVVGDMVNDEDELVKVELPSELAKEIANQIDDQTQDESGTVDDLMPDGIPEESEVAIEAGNKRPVKVAATPKKVEDISSGVEGKVKGGTGTIGKEQAFDAKAPIIPSRGNASKIKGEKDTIPEMTLPDIAADSATMGDEANTLKGTPAVNTDIRGRVIAKTTAEPLTKEAKKPNQVEDISSGVEGKVKGGTGTIGNEQAFDAKAPSIPSKGSKSEIAGETETIPDADLPDIPVDSATMGGEAESLKGTPPVNNDIRGRVLSDTRRENQLSKVMAARHKKACQVAAKLMGRGQIAEADYDAVIEDLSKIEVDRIEAFADRMFRNVKMASVVPTLSTPIVQEASAYSPKLPKTLAERLKGIFTIGTQQLNERVMEDDRKDEVEAQE